ncbi:Copper binding protein, plastocyanin/azurin family [Georgenia satyanarayanai]|uniref:Copper binding protein, plastocyanin/azurin family n=1 Tax=Georgenia satyanarayanai TaxID=860221 RepID=A0A2Y9AQK2_9MICO|nr:plastocyanin/azurin family copper-binding protein [Georgenia satyanarayanai]PYF97279.1 copper binding plastocyanin/azurin family protein [Georgenia satyanarayanai]SSA46365.1 Copper binding protein, plastocyanin/azurin family [Georgenia satyanarayanai]
MSQLASPPRPRTQRRQTLRRVVVALLAALTGLTLVPTTAGAADQTLTWTAGNSVTDYLTAPESAVAGTATIIFENSRATGNTTGMPHTLTFDTSTPGYNHDVDLNIVANPFDANGGYYEAEVTLTPGTYRYFCTIPGHGQMWGELVVTGDGGEPDPDTTAPTVTADVTGEQDEDGAYVGSATVALTAADEDGGSGVDTVEYSLDGGEYAAYSAPLEVTEPGAHTVDFRATDVAGNTGEGSVSFTVVEPDVEPEPDTTAPEVSAAVTGEQDEDGAYVDSATVTITATDEDGGSGLDTVEYSLDGAEYTAYTEALTVSEPGAHTVDFRATDVAGNTAEGSVSFTVVEPDVEPEPDTTAPEVSAAVTGEQDEDGAYVGSATVTITATDEDGGSGLGMVEYSLDGGEFTHYHEALTVSEPGEHTVDYRASDVAGNVGEGSVTFTVVEADVEPDPDETAPEVTAAVTGEQDEDGAYVATATVTITATDEDGGSGVESVEYSLDGGEYAAYTEPLVVSEPGAHTVDYRAADVAGNTAEGSVSFTVAEEVVEPEPDETAPEVTAAVTGEQDEDGAYVGSATVTITATDEDGGSGIATVEYSLDGAGYTAYSAPVEVTEPGAHTVDYRATDVAGNTAEGTVSLTVVEAEEPDPGECTDTRATVVIGDVDTGVSNAGTEDGCLNDLIDEDGDYATRGAFVRHVGDVLRPLVADDVLTARDLGTILRTAARSSIGG